MRLVLDTNVLIAALVADGLCRDLVRRRARAHTQITSPQLLAELTDKLLHKFGVQANEVPWLAAYQERAEIVRPDALPEAVCRDPDDDWVLATAIAGEAEAIVTGDADLLDLNEYQGIRILSPRAFAEWMDRLM
jgi:putative PIN family toxin of toxin-antitoxin system